MAKVPDDKARHMARLVEAGHHISQVAGIFDVDEKVVRQAVKAVKTGNLDSLLPVRQEKMDIESKYLIFNHYSGWMVVEWNPYVELWMDLNHVQSVEHEHIVIAYQLPKKPRS